MTSRRNFSLNQTLFDDIARGARDNPSLIHELFASPFASQAIFQALPPLARLYVARLLPVSSDVPIPLNAFRKTLRRRQRAHDRHNSAVRALRALHIFAPSKADVIDVDGPSAGDVNGATPESTTLFLHPRFASNIRRSITYSLPPVFDGPTDHPVVSTQVLDKFSADRLEYILNYLVESSGMNAPAGNLVQALLGAHILEDKRNALCITSSGFHFLLKHSFAQLWVLLRSILFVSFSSSLNEPLRLLFSLTYAQPGAPYSVLQLTDLQRNLLTDLHQLGVVIISDDEDVFRPTVVGIRLLSFANRVGADLSAADLPNVTKTAGEIHIFVETNFRVYAYTASPFQVNLLGLFTHLRFKLPGMVVGHLTREAVRNALMNGITGDQIIAYLNAHAHPRMKNGVIPSNVSDEIRLWEAEQDRVQMAPGVLLSDFSSPYIFERTVSFTTDLGAALWVNTQQQKLFVDAENYDTVKKFLRNE